MPVDAREDDGRVVGVVRTGYRIGDEVLGLRSCAVAKSRQTVD